MYIIYYNVPYEEICLDHVESLQEAKEWLKNRRSSYGYNLDNVDIVQILQSFNPYDIAQGKFD